MENVTRHEWISVAAYYRAEARNFAPGKALDDWLAAEYDYVRLQIANFLTMAEEDGTMTITGLHHLAELVGVENADQINLKIELIQAIQDAAHHRPCFRSDPDMNCRDSDCQWRAECRRLIAEWCRK